MPGWWQPTWRSLPTAKRACRQAELKLQEAASMNSMPPYTGLVIYDHMPCMHMHMAGMLAASMQENQWAHACTRMRCGAANTVRDNKVVTELRGSMKVVHHSMISMRKQPGAHSCGSQRKASQSTTNGSNTIWLLNIQLLALGARGQSGTSCCHQTHSRGGENGCEGHTM
jgi:hypothetical protein